MTSQQQCHSWDDDILKQYGDDRCSGCAMKKSTYDNAISNLVGWPNKEKETQDWKDQMRYYQTCPRKFK